MNTRNFFRFLAQAWSAGVDNSLTERLIRAGADPSSLGAAPHSAAGGGAHPGGGDSGASPRVVEQTLQGVPRLTAEMRDALARYKGALLLLAASGCVFRKEGIPCRLLPDLDRDAGWCVPCIAAEALNPQAPSVPVSATPGIEVKPRSVT